MRPCFCCRAALLVAAVCLGLTGLVAADYPVPGPAPAPGMLCPLPSPSSAPAPLMPVQPAPQEAALPAAPALTMDDGEQVAAGGRATFNMLGDLLSGPTVRCLPVRRVIAVDPRVALLPPNVVPGVAPVPLPPGTVAVVVVEQRCVQLYSAASRASAFKIGENESPVPQDRVYFGFNYFDSVNEAVNRRLGGTFADVDVYRETLGFEKTFLDGQASVGLRVPFGTVDLSSPLPGIATTESDIGDLSVVLKYAPYFDPLTGNVVSGGLVVTAPTGPREFNPFNTTLLQPWVGTRLFLGDSLFVHGFSSLAVPTDSDDVTLLFNDIGVGYVLYRNASPCAWLTAVVPTAEAHLTTPLNHRGQFDLNDPVATPDILALTGAITFEVKRIATIAVGAAVPVTGPRPYDFEILAQINVRF